MNTATSGEIVALLRRAAQWRLAGLLFEPPGEHWSQQVAALCGEVGDPLLEQAAAAALKEAAELSYHTLFGPGGQVSLREVTYHPMAEPGQLLAELAELYQVFGYRPKLAESPDHFAVEVGFVAYLLVKEAFARHCGEADKAARTADVAAHFCHRHVAFMARPLAEALSGVGLEHLVLAAEAIARRVDQLSAPVRSRPR